MKLSSVSPSEYQVKYIFLIFLNFINSKENTCRSDVIILEGYVPFIMSGKLFKIYEIIWIVAVQGMLRRVDMMHLCFSHL